MGCKIIIEDRVGYGVGARHMSISMSMFNSEFHCNFSYIWETLSSIMTADVTDLMKGSPSFISHFIYMVCKSLVECMYVVCFHLLH